MLELITPLEADDTWLCHHVDASGVPVAPARLRLSDTHEWPHRVENFRRWVNCPDCGTRWRVWTQLRQAKPALRAWKPDPLQRSSKGCRHAPVRDVDRVIELVLDAVPSISVQQYENAWPVDDEGLWLFYESGSGFSPVQIESSYGCCPFIVEGVQCRTGTVIDEVVQYVLEELRTAEGAA